MALPAEVTFTKDRDAGRGDAWSVAAGERGMGWRGWGQRLVMSQNTEGVPVSFKRHR